MKKYRLNPKEFEAIQLDGSTRQADEIREWSHGILRDNWDSRTNNLRVSFNLKLSNGDFAQSDIGDWILKSVEGFFTLYRQHIFVDMYEEV